jgi:uncharacterized coiled-coil protein SlyX
LSTDLTPAGLESLKEIVTNANNNVAKVQTALDALINGTDDSSVQNVIDRVQCEGAKPPDR